jgi:large subunit ribosomal protein L6
MSKIGRNPIALGAGVTADLSADKLSVKGKLGVLELSLDPSVRVSQEEGALLVRPADETQRSRTMWGTTASLVKSMVVGVREGFRVNLELHGVGYRAAIQGSTLTLQLGFSHDVVITVPKGIEVTCAKPTEISVFGINKQAVGQIAANIRRYRPPEPYKGKGIRYVGEEFVRKVGKSK